MASPLESAITLEDVFAMVVGKRVPLAPELAGYLCLEVAEKADSAGSGGGAVDPRSVYIADEGTVALVRPRTERAATGGDAEESIRSILAQLLEASGSSTPALTAVSRRTRAGSLRALMEDIEAALIPVNRAAGRRALARLAREVKRVTHGVGRNASASRALSGEWSARGSRPDDVSGARRDRVDAPESRGASRLPRVTPPPVLQQAPSARAVVEASDAFGVPDSLQSPGVDGAGAAGADRPIAMFDNPSDVDSLLEQFSRSTSPSADSVSRDLKDLVDVGETALPPMVAARPDVSLPTPDSFPPPRSTGARSAPPSLPPSSYPPPSYPPGSFPPPSSGPPRSAPRSAPPRSSAPPSDPDVDDLLAGSEEPIPPPPRLPSAPNVKPARPADAAAAAAVARSLPTHLSIPVPAAEWARPKKKRTDYWIVIAILAVLAAASATVWFFKPGFISGRTAEKVAEERAANEALKLKMQAAQQVLSCHAALDVTDVPTGAEVLIRVGQAPVDVPHLPVGARLEFVATAEGFAPKRVVVPSTATWDNGADGKPRFEVAVQLDRSNPKAKLGDPWPPGDPGSEVGGKGAAGTVHLVSTPRGAEIWMLAGLGPEAIIEQLPCDQSMDVLVAGPTTFRKRLHAAASDFAPRPGETTSKMAKLSAK